MKRIIALGLVLVLALSMVGCGKKGIDEGPYTLNPIEKVDWGITISAENITPSGVTIVVSQAGGNPTGELQFGSDYTLQVWKNDTWENVPYIIDEDSVAWTAEAYMLPMNGSNKQEIQWDAFYGELPAGRYLLTKSFQDFRGSGDYDTAHFSVEFAIQ